MWVPDGDSDAVTEINAATGALIRVIDAPEYQFSGPDAIAAAGDGVWVVNVDGGSVTEINAATGALVRVISSVTNVPFAIAADQSGVWLMTNLGVKAVDELAPTAWSTSSAPPPGSRCAHGRDAVPVGQPGRRDHRRRRPRLGDGHELLQLPRWVAELSARTGGLVRVIGARSGHLERS